MKLIRILPGPLVEQDQSIFGPPHRQNLHHLGVLKEKPVALAQGLKELFVGVIVVQYS